MATLVEVEFYVAGVVWLVEVRNCLVQAGWQLGVPFTKVVLVA